MAGYRRAELEAAVVRGGERWTGWRGARKDLKGYRGTSEWFGMCESCCIELSSRERSRKVMKRESRGALAKLEA